MSMKSLKSRCAANIISLLLLTSVPPLDALFVCNIPVLRGATNFVCGTLKLCRFCQTRGDDEEEDSSAAPSLTPTASPVLSPTASPVLSPTASPVLSPTAPPTVFASPTASPTDCPTPLQGCWGELTDWGGVIPVGVANIVTPTGNKILGFAAAQGTAYITNPGANSYTYAKIYDPATNSFEQADLNGHDIFCGALTMLPDGRLFAGGGGQLANSYKVSTFDPQSMTWTRHKKSLLGHWYGTAIAKDDRVMLALGNNQFTETSFKRINYFPEVSAPNFDFDHDTEPWQNLSSVDLKNKGPDVTHWYPQMHLMPNGEILESGTMNNMYRIDTNGNGTISFVGKRNDETEEEESFGASTVYFDAGKVMALGGLEGYGSSGFGRGTNVFQRAIIIDFADPDNIFTYPAAPLHKKRAFQSAVTLPTGEILVLGGKSSLPLFDDAKSVYEAEIYDPVADTWTLLSPQQQPRNYHSTSILLEDGRVFSGGGGLCGSCYFYNAKNYDDHQIFSPPYLYDSSSGNLRARPVIESAPTTIEAGMTFQVQVSGEGANEITRFSFIKQCVITHSISTEQRQIVLEHNTTKTDLAGGINEYNVMANDNLYIMIPGHWFLFAVNSDGTPSVSVTIQVNATTTTTTTTPTSD